MMKSMALALLLAAAPLEAAQQPDLVLVVTDDQAYVTLPFMPSTLALLADQGIVFEKGFANTPLCCPARATILTGLFSRHHRVYGNTFPNGGALAFDDTSTLAVWLQDGGYRTGLFGKWLNGYEDLQPWPYVAPGWTEWHALKSAGYKGGTMVENGVEVAYPTSSYTTSRLGTMVADFIASTPAEQPLFALYTPFAPHAPAIPEAQDLKKFAGVSPYRPPNFNEQDVSDKPTWIRKLPLLSGTKIAAIDKLYRKMLQSLQSVDRAVASIVGALEARGRPYVLVYTTDNGYSLGSHRWEKKSCVYEECVHVPFLVRGTGILPRVEPGLVQHVDLAPTFMELAGLPLPDSTDGTSFAARLFSDQLSGPENVYLEFLANGRPTQKTFEAVRTSQHLYAVYGNGNRELYDLLSDPAQLQNRVNDPSLAVVRDSLAAVLDVYTD